MVDREILNELFEPIQLAINNGIAGGLRLSSLAEFKRQFPIYGEFDDSHFKRLNGEWMADAYVIKTICKTTLADPSSTPEHQAEAKVILRQINDIRD